MVPTATDPWWALSQSANWRPLTAVGDEALPRSAWIVDAHTATPSTDAPCCKDGLTSRSRTLLGGWVSLAAGMATLESMLNPLTPA